MGEWGRWGRANPSDRAITALLNSAQRHVWPLNHLHHLENRTACSYDHNAWPVRALVTLNHLHHVTSYTRGRSRPSRRTLESPEQGGTGTAETETDTVGFGRPMYSAL